MSALIDHLLVLRTGRSRREVGETVPELLESLADHETTLAALLVTLGAQVDMMPLRQLYAATAAKRRAQAAVYARLATEAQQPA
ncbi:hypothetical protein [Luteolibacter sp. Populi]|uniref:hypothetical protein n=1 Tax=Luteolibacter sp. Populi TaxID=3230487 RepID=UPI003465DE9A